MEKCCGTIILNEGNILVIKQTEGHYGFPKGHTEENETEIQTAIRETKEETNIDVEIISEERFINSYTLPNGIKKEVIFFLAKPLSTEIKIQDTELTECIWVPIKEVPNYFEYQNSYDLWEEVLPAINKLNI